MSDNKTTEPVPKGEGFTPMHMTPDMAIGALNDFSERAGKAGGYIEVSQDWLDAIAAAFRCSEKELEHMRHQAEDYGKRLGSLCGYMARYVDAVEREAYCKRDALEAFKEREVALAEMKRVAMEA